MSPCRRVDLILPVGISSLDLMVSIKVLDESRLVTRAIERMRGMQAGVLVGSPVGLSPLLCIQHLIGLGNSLQR